MQTKTAAKKVTRRQHSNASKAEVVAACRQPGATIASSARQHDINPSLVRCWLQEWLRWSGLTLSGW
ncbi:transposase [Noviherbaspirillum humi]|uniref:transposase n=1 Tax=Noviherbaspirillum humi TaxID=1688639 RepID=UPI000B78362C